MAATTHAGFSLVELMVGLSLGLIVTGVILLWAWTVTVQRYVLVFQSQAPSAEPKAL